MKNENEAAASENVVETGGEVRRQSPAAIGREGGLKRPFVRCARVHARVVAERQCWHRGTGVEPVTATALVAAAYP